MSDRSTVHDLYEQWVEELAELEPQLDRIRTRIEQLRTLTATIAQMDEFRASGSSKPHAPEASPDSQSTASDAEFDTVIDLTDEGALDFDELTTADAILTVLRDARRPLGPSDVLAEMERRGIAPSESADPLKLVNTHLGRMRLSSSSPVRRAARGIYYYDARKEAESEA